MKGIQLAPVIGYIGENAQSARLLVTTLLVVAASAWLSLSGRETTQKARAETESVVAIRETANRFARQFVLASSAETDEWSRTTAQAAEYGVPVEQRLSLAGSVSRIAEAAGLTSVMVRFAGSDSVAAANPRKFGDIVFQPAPFGLTLEGSGGAMAMARTVLRLPPATQISALTLSGDTEALRGVYQLGVYLPAGGSND